MDIEEVERAQQKLIMTGPQYFSPAWISLLVSILDFAQRELFKDGKFQGVKFFQIGKIFKIAGFFVNMVKQLIKLI